jgi:drug/metabolite transporter (DMT)-like permease
VAGPALLVVLACVFFAGSNALGKAVQGALPGPALHPLQITAARFLFAFMALSPFIWWRGRGVWRTAAPWRHAQRVALGAAGVTLLFTALGSLRLADATAIVWSAPLFTLVFAAALMGEAVTARRWAAAGVGFLGVLVMLRPGAGIVEPMALVALLAAICVGAEVATIRVLAARDGALTILALNNAMGAALACLAALPVLVWPSPLQLLGLLGVGVVMVTGQAIFLLAAARAEASVLAPFYYATLLWAAAIGAVAFGEWPDAALLVGATLIVAAGVGVSLPTRRAPEAPRPTP